MEEYTIPESIRKRIPDYFYFAIGGELVSIFGTGVFECDEDGMQGIDFIAGTAGHYAAFRMTCRKLGMQWLLDYWEELMWYDSDAFDSEILFNTNKCFDEYKGDANPYYVYLVKDSKMGAHDL